MNIYVLHYSTEIMSPDLIKQLLASEGKDIVFSDFLCNHQVIFIIHFYLI